MLQKILFPTLLLLSATVLFAQTPTPTPTPSKEDEKVRKDAVEFLRQTVVEVNNMPSLENRLSFGSELASLMWFYDPKESRTMYLGVTSDFRQLLLNFDAQLNSQAMPSGDDDGYSGGIFADITDRMRIDRKIQTALSLRKQIALSLAEHEPDLAMAFYNDSTMGLSNPALVERVNVNDTYFEFQLMTAVAETNAARAAEYGKRSLDKGVTFQHIELLKKIYASDQEKGASFAAAIASKIKSDKLNSAEPYILSQFVEFSAETLDASKKDSKKSPVLSESDLRDIVDFYAKSILDMDDVGYGALPMEIIEKYAPSRAMLLKAKLAKSMSANSMNSMANAVNSAVAYSSANAAANSNAAAQKRRESAEAKLAAEKKMMDDVQNLGTKPLSTEERTKVVSELRIIIAKNRDKDKRVIALSLLAAQVAKAGDKELASVVMKEAESVAPTQPKNYQDYLLTWLIAAGYADVNTDKSFSLLSDTILRLNDTVAAFVKVAEFIDAKGEIIDGGDLQVGQFGGSIIRDLTKGLSVSTPTLRTLAKADFVKLKSLTNTFDRPELRIFAKMLVLRAVLNDKPEKRLDIDAVLTETGAKQP